MIETRVLIVGGGPVGLTLGMELARRGIGTIVAEMRHRGEPPSVKCNHVSARSMEIFRRLGVAAKLRDTGLPPDYPNDISYRVSFTGRELSRIPIPCRRDRYTATGGPDTWWPTPEPPARINQIFLEPIIFERQRKAVEVVHEIDARQGRHVEVHPPRAHVRSAADVQALHAPRLYACGDHAVTE